MAAPKGLPARRSFSLSPRKHLLWTGAQQHLQVPQLRVCLTAASGTRVKATGSKSHTLKRYPLVGFDRYIYPPEACVSVTSLCLSRNAPISYKLSNLLA